MSQSEPHDAGPNAMSPEAEAVIARARRSFALSIGLLLLGFFAVALAVVYRSGGGEETPGSDYALGVIAVPAGAEIVSAVPGEGMIAVTYRTGGVTRVRLLNGTTGAVIRDIDFASE